MKHEHMTYGDLVILLEGSIGHPDSPDHVAVLLDIVGGCSVCQSKLTRVAGALFNEGTLPVELYRMMLLYKN